MLQFLNNTLENLEKIILETRSQDLWKSMMIDYETPNVERLWIQAGENRIYLHRILPCSTETFLHPHPWPSAMKVLKGGYEMDLLFDDGETKGLIATLELRSGSAYTMPVVEAWHRLKVKEEVLSVMVSGPLFEKQTIVKRPDRVMSPLSNKKKEKLFNDILENLRK